MRRYPPANAGYLHRVNNLEEDAMDVIALTLLALALGAGLGYAAIRFRVEGDPVVDEIDAILPQTQCGQCGYPGCRPYAEALASGEADINQCPPGGERGMLALADLLGAEPKPMDAAALDMDEETPMVAIVDESICIGCTKCVQVCPVDAIVGAAKQVHTVIEAHCTGCKLCLPPLCPVPDCIVLQQVPQRTVSWQWPYPVDKAPERAA
jgi:electron transport complex protein RnfB